MESRRQRRSGDGFARLHLEGRRQRRSGDGFARLHLEGRRPRRPRVQTLRGHILRSVASAPAAGCLPRACRGGGAGPPEFPVKTLKGRCCGRSQLEGRRPRRPRVRTLQVHILRSVASAPAAGCLPRACRGGGAPALQVHGKHIKSKRLSTP
jgi:hypothetical protein